MASATTHKVFFLLLAAACFWPKVSSAHALLLGLATALLLKHPWPSQVKKITPKLLSYSVVGLGAGMSLPEVARAGMWGLGLTVLSIAATFSLGLLLGRLLKTDHETSTLISVGTAICGGSAIAAVAPTLNARPAAISVSLGVVFLLNATALMVFPWVGHTLHLSQTQFGWWSALAIHDTSSVVGATLRYGQEALSIGTTVKLARALYIVPMTMAVAFFVRRQPSDTKEKPPVKRPWFILGFLAMAALMTWVPALQPAQAPIEWLSRRGLVLSLFLIGSQLNRDTLREVGLRPLIQGGVLWLLTLVATLGLVRWQFS